MIDDKKFNEILESGECFFHAIEDKKRKDIYLNCIPLMSIKRYNTCQECLNVIKKEYFSSEDTLCEKCVDIIIDKEEINNEDLCTECKITLTIQES